MRDQGGEAYSNRAGVGPTHDVARAISTSEEEPERRIRTCKDENLYPCTLLDSLKEEELAVQDKFIAASAINTDQAETSFFIAKLGKPNWESARIPRWGSKHYKNNIRKLKLHQNRRAESTTWT